MNPIIISGAHRSGTTWVGQMIAASGQARYVHEPFHISFAARAKITQWFQYVYKGWEHEADVKAYMDQKLGFTMPEVLRRLKRIKDIGDLANFFDDVKLKLQNKPALMKDPIALFSLDWLAENYDPKVVLMIRHPAAFVGSLKVAKWHFPFKDLADQEALMSQMPTYSDTIKQYSQNPPDIIDQGILLWNIFHHQILSYQARRSDWFYVRHEDLSREPEVEFKKLMERLGLEYNSKMETAIQASSKPDVQTKWARHSKDNIFSWKNRLTPAEIDRVRAGTETVATKFYFAADW